MWQNSKQQAHFNFKQFAASPRIQPKWSFCWWVSCLIVTPFGQLRANVQKQRCPKTLVFSRHIYELSCRGIQDWNQTSQEVSPFWMPCSTPRYNSSPFCDSDLAVLFPWSHLQRRWMQYLLFVQFPLLKILFALTVVHFKSTILRNSQV